MAATLSVGGDGSAFALTAEPSLSPSPSPLGHPQAPVPRPLEWPPVADVDLVAEFPWFLLHQHTVDECTQRADTHSELHEQQDSKTVDGGVDHPRPHSGPLASPPKKSPYTQILRAPHVPPPQLSPAQRAARKILQLQTEDFKRLEDEEEELEQRRGRSSARTASKETASTVGILSPPTTRVAHRRHQQMNKTNKQSKQPQPQRAPTQAARLTHWLANNEPSPLDDSHASNVVQYSMEMEARIHSTLTATLGKGLWADQVASPIAAELSSESVFGGFVATRRLGLPLQDDTSISDQPTLLPSTELSSPGIHAEADAVPVSIRLETTGVLEPELCVPPVAEPSKTAAVAAERTSVVEMFADQVLDDARLLVQDGDVTDALQTLEAGIHRVLHDFQDNQDEILTHGFDFSSLAHEMATRVQLKYKARHRNRVASLILIQRVWKRFRVQHQWQKQRLYQATNAQVIQKYYKKRFFVRKREKSAIRIQTCFRVFQEQKHLIWFHQACRMLLTQARQEREQRKKFYVSKKRFWIKMRVIQRFLWLIKIRKFSICCLQKRYRGWKARQSYTDTLTQAAHQEMARRGNEDAFVAPRLEKALALWSHFYRHTETGKAQVDWKCKLPWLRWRRLRKSWPRVALHDRVATLCGIYNGGGGGEAREDGTVAVVRNALEQSCIRTVLVRERFHDTRPRSVHSPVLIPLRLDVDTLLSWLPPANGSVTEQRTKVLSWSTSPYRLVRWASTVRTQRTRQCATFRHATLRLLLLLAWFLLFYPRLLARSSLVFNRRVHQEGAVAEVMQSHRRVTQSLLRLLFRLTENDLPNYVCTWCGEGFATTRTFYAHRNASKTGCVVQKQIAEQEHRTVLADLEYLENKKKNAWWPKWRNLFRPKITNANSYVAPVDGSGRHAVDKWTASFAVDAAHVHRVAALHRQGSKAALRTLVAIAETCGLPADGSLVWIPTELLALVLFALDESVHPLERVQASTLVDQWTLATTGGPPPPRDSHDWIQTTEACQALLGVPFNTGPAPRYPDTTRSIAWYQRLAHEAQARWSSHWRQLHKRKNPLPPSTPITTAPRPSSSRVLAGL